MGTMPQKTLRNTFNNNNYLPGTVAFPQGF